MVIIKYTDTLISKNKLKKLLLLKFFCNNITPSKNIKFVTNLNHVKHKNIVLSSPFHFKTVKSHLYIPTFSFYITTDKYVQINDVNWKFIGKLNYIYSEKVVHISL